MAISDDSALKYDRLRVGRTAIEPILSNQDRFDTSTPAVVLQLNRNPIPYGALAAVRTLGRLGIPVINVRPSLSPPIRSHYVVAVEEILGDLDDADRVTEALITASQRCGSMRPVLFATDDLGALHVDAHFEKLIGRYRIPQSPVGLARTLSDKSGLAALCERHGIPSPRTVQSRDALELDDYLTSFAYPVVVKSADPQVLARSPGQRSVSIARNPDEVRTLFPLPPWRSSNLLIQEYLPGDATTVWMFNGYLGKDGRLLAGFTGQKLRQHPIDTGCTALGVCRANDEIRSRAEQFLTAAGYRGIVDMGFRYDARENTYKLLDVNPRLGATFRLFVGHDDIDVVRAMYLDLTDQPVVAAPGIEGRRWLVEQFDVSSSLRMWRRGDLSFHDWRQSYRDLEEVAWYAPDDVWPTACLTMRYVRLVVRDGLAHTKRRSAKPAPTDTTFRRRSWGSNFARREIIRRR
jgi:D-aspartate ligase